MHCKSQSLFRAIWGAATAALLLIALALVLSHTQNGARTNVSGAPHPHWRGRVMASVMVDSGCSGESLRDGGRYS
jgi:hypothetical protein